MKLLTPENFPRLETPVIVGLPPPFEMRACLLAAAAAFNVPAPMAPAPVAYATPATGYVPVEQTYLRGAVPSDVYLSGWVVAVDRPNVGRSVLGCIEADFCNQCLFCSIFLDLQYRHVFPPLVVSQK